MRLYGQGTGIIPFPCLPALNFFETIEISVFDEPVGVEDAAVHGDANATLKILVEFIVSIDYYLRNKIEPVSKRPFGAIEIISRHIVLRRNGYGSKRIHRT
ncbi:MAG: hypothetical protein JRI80_08915 [Deltaproteobacteria bacterium]|nr:hypothetical protein [Deltaproteobacteria bacterium]